VYQGGGSIPSTKSREVEGGHLDMLKERMSIKYQKYYWK
jgi:hypothetical protein